MPLQTRQPSNRLQRILAFIAVALIGLSVIAIIVMLIVSAVGMKLASAGWAPVYLFPLIGLPLGALCIIALVVIGTVERRKLASEVSK